MIWVAFGTGIILGVFSGMLLQGLIREFAISRGKSRSARPMPTEPSIIYEARESQRDCAAIQKFSSKSR